MFLVDKTIKPRARDFTDTELEKFSTFISSYIDGMVI
jgi:hypothetical protein